jgi:hypothetical protein
MYGSTPFLPGLRLLNVSVWLVIISIVSLIVRDSLSRHPSEILRSDRESVRVIAFVVSILFFGLVIQAFLVVGIFFFGLIVQTFPELVAILFNITIFLRVGVILVFIRQ